MQSATCIINNYNYSDYILDAVESALCQSVSFTQIIVVDDASTDGSPNLLSEKYGNDSRITLLLKEKNEGQLACFNDGLKLAYGDIIFFLDADDEYHRDYLAKALAFYRKHADCGFLVCAYEQTGLANETVALYPFDCSLGYSLVSTKFAKHWVGAPTSMISIKKFVLDKFMPIPHTQDWRTRADDCLVWGSSLTGVKKYYLSTPLIRYRIHNKNAFNGKKFDGEYKYLRRVSISRLFAYLNCRLPYDESAVGLALREFKQIPYPSYKQLKTYWRIIRREPHNFFRKPGKLAVLYYFYLRGKFAVHRKQRENLSRDTTEKSQLTLETK